MAKIATWLHEIWAVTVFQTVMAYVPQQGGMRRLLPPLLSWPHSVECATRATLPAGASLGCFSAAMLWAAPAVDPAALMCS
jgi:hypothetical protein